MKKRIMFFRTLIYIGGTENAVLNLLKHIYKDYEIYIGYTNDESDKGMLNEFKKYGKVLKIDENVHLDVDLFITTSSGYKQDVPVAKNIKRKKTILWLHHFLHSNKTVLREKWIDKVDKIIVVSNTALNTLKEEYSNLSNKATVIYNVINNDDIIEKSNIPISLELSDNLNLVTVARVKEEKGFDRVYRLAEELKNRNIDFKWFSIGGNIDVNEYEGHKERFKKFGDSFVWVGPSDNPHNIVKQCDYSVLLSNYETWGLVITEAMILGVPCICTDFEAAFEQIEDKKNGIILSRNNLDSYKDRIDDIINNKEKYKKEVSNYNYNNEEIIKEWRKLIDEV